MTVNGSRAKPGEPENRPPGQESATPSHRAFPALDGVRALAVVAVLATHSAYWTGRYENGAFDGVLARLDFGVALFFLLSGFLLFRPWLEAAVTGRPSPELRVYFWRRGLRILPAYWVAVAFAFVLLHQNRGNVSFGDWVRHATLTQAYSHNGFRPGLTQMWSLCAEAAFYVVLPLFGWLAVRLTVRYGWRPSHLLAGCAVLAGVTVGWDVFIFHNGWWLTTSAQIWLPAYLDWFAVGMALAIVSVHLHHRPVRDGSSWNLVHEIAANPALCWLMAAALYAIALTPIAGPKAVGLPTTQTAITKSLVYAAVAVLMLWPLIFGTRSVADAIFGNPYARRLGDISYGMFLFHLALLEGVAVPILGYRLFQGSAVAVFIITLALSIVAAVLSYRVVERPAARLRRLVRPRPGPTNAPGPPRASLGPVAMDDQVTAVRAATTPTSTTPDVVA